MTRKRKVPNSNGPAASKGGKRRKIEKKNAVTKTPGKNTVPGPGKSAAVGSKADSEQNKLRKHLKDPTWKKKTEDLFLNDYFKDIERNLQQEIKSKAQVFPSHELVFNAFNLTPFDKVSVVILGQDPYHDDGQAEGLSFSVPKGIPIPGSLRNVYKEVKTDYPTFTPPDHGHLGEWAKQGVLLLNATLTVRAHEPNSHAKFGWQKFTNDIIQTISAESKDGVVFLLWGNFAHKKEKLVDSSRHSVIKTAHPSGLSYSKFRDCHCFRDVNKALEKLGKKEIDWTVL